jgi:hypothetical protein
MIGAGVVIAIVTAVSIWKSRLPDHTDIFERTSRFPYPGIYFLRNTNVFLELGLKPEQIEFILDPGKLQRSPAEIARYGNDYNEINDDIIRLERIEKQFTDPQRKRYAELCLQFADTLALRDEEVAGQLSLTDLQNKQISTAQKSFDEARNIRKTMNESARLGEHRLYNSGELAGRLSLEIARLDGIPNWIDHSERIYIRSLLTEQQKLKLEDLKGTISSIVNFDHTYWQSQFSAQTVYELLCDSGFQSRNHLDRDLISSAWPEVIPTWQTTYFRAWAPALALAKIWPKLKPAQREAIFREEIVRSSSLRDVMRPDFAELLGMSNDERDRLCIRWKMRDWANFIEYRAMAARSTKVTTSYQGASSTDLSIGSFTEPRSDIVQDHDVVLWAGMSTPVRKKWLELGGKEPKVRPLGR